MSTLSASVKAWVEATELGDEATRVEDDVVAEYAGAIDLGIYSILNLVQDLGPYLGFDAEKTVVARGKLLLEVSFLRSDLAQLSVYYLQFLVLYKKSHRARIVISALTTYFCTRLSNPDEDPSFRAGVHEVARSLNIIINWQRFVPSDAATVISAIFTMANYSVLTTLPPPTRLDLLLVVDSLFRKRDLALIKAIRIPTLISGLVSLAEIEKNPSCLKIVFSLYAHLSGEWDLKAAEFRALWGSFSRYYPITLGSTVKDPSQPTQETLRDLLLQCIISNDYYASVAIPMCLEKLDTTADLSASTKVEVLDTLTACVEKYSVTALDPWSLKIWDSLKFEIWNGEVDDFIKSSLKVFYTLVVSLSRTCYDWDNSNSPLASFTTPVNLECSILASGSPAAFYHVVKAIIPKLDVLWQGLKLASEKNLLLGVTNNLLIARLAQPDVVARATAPATYEGTASNVLKMKDFFSNFCRAITGIYFSAVTLIATQNTADTGPDPVYGVAAIFGLKQLFQIPDYLSAVERGMILQKLTEFALNQNEDSEIGKAVVDALQRISSVEPKIFEEITLSNLVDTLPVKLSDDGEKQKYEVDSVLARLENLVSISCTSVCETEFRDGPPVGVTAGYWHRNFDSMVKKVLAKLNIIMQQDGQMRYAIALVAAIADGLRQFEETLASARSHSTEPGSANSSSGPYTYIVMELLSLTVAQKTDENGNLFVGLKPYILSAYAGAADTFVELVGRVAMLALRSKSTTALNNFVLSWNEKFSSEPSAIWSLFTHSKDGFLAVSQQNLARGPAEKCLANALSMYLLAGSPPKSKEGLRISAGDVAATMIRNAVSPNNQSSPFSQSAMLSLLQLLVNKFGASKETLEDGSSLLAFMKTVLDDALSLSNAQVDKAYQALAYFATASLASFDPTMVPLISYMVSGVGDVKHGRKIARSFRILLAPSPILTAENYCMIRKLRKSRLYTLAVDPLIILLKGASTKDLRENYLIAIAGILVYMEPTYLSEGTNVEHMMRLILEGINVTDDDFTKVAYLRTLVGILPLCPALIQEHLDSVLNRVSDCLRITYDAPSGGSVQCRILAVQILALLILLMKPSTLIQRSTKILKELDAAKNDVSWEVRQKATQCRMQWFYMADRAK
ncbi:hypothetical protein QTJ16_000211 [Diplocarpon rosae]|uniref:MMS19 nucleotide excision repair protein n=1 Tax=Diplocarpon rosae TaxID=946125 RepID=A0AAD9T4I7_9HELO|nr:hypothetical protein QTJ16_000211 [Diplocarpon rosae]